MTKMQHSNPLVPTVKSVINYKNRNKKLVLTINNSIAQVYKKHSLFIVQGALKVMPFLFLKFY